MHRLKSQINCTLCGAEAYFFRAARQRRYYQCNRCRSVLLDPDDYVSLQEEKERYEKHNNDVHDPRYQRFVLPIVEQVLNNQTTTEKGLDYGAGTGPVITRLLRDRHYHILTYDPFFDNDPDLLESTYDYIVCNEVAEHFHHPFEEFHRLYHLLNARGKLYCMTQLYDERTDFEQWNYKNDETHVIFYHAKALEWIRDKLGFSTVHIKDNKLITLQI